MNFANANAASTKHNSNHGVDAGCLYRSLSDTQYKVLTAEEELALTQAIESKRCQVMRDLAEFSGILEKISKDLGEYSAIDRFSLSRHVVEVRENMVADVSLPDKKEDRTRKVVQGVTDNVYPIEALVFGPAYLEGLVTRYFKRSKKKRANYQSYMRLREKLISANLRLSAKVASKYTSVHCSQSDLLQLGNEGLIRAVDKFNPARKLRFSTSATQWIRQSITREVLHNHTQIRFSEKVLRNISTMRREIENYAHVNGGKKPDDEALAKLSDLSVGFVSEYRNYMYSMQTFNGSDDGDDTGNRNLEEVISSEDEQLQEEFVAQDQKVAMIKKAFRYITPQQRAVLKMYFGFGQKEPLQATVIADKLGMVRQTVYKEIAAGLKTIREKFGADLEALVE